MTSSAHRFCLDENLPVSVCAPISGLYPHHRFETVNSLGLSGALDVQLFRALRDGDFEAIITADQMHLVRSEEHHELVACGLHWIGLHQLHNVRGRAVAALQTATILSALPQILDDWRSTPHEYLIPPVTRGNLTIIPL